MATWSFYLCLKFKTVKQHVSDKVSYFFGRSMLIVVHAWNILLNFNNIFKIEIYTYFLIINGF